MADKPLHVFTPGPVEMIRRGWGGSGGTWARTHRTGWYSAITSATSTRAR